jgi:nitrogen fixation/metabolism regulation signal transduction histidine kinase
MEIMSEEVGRLNTIVHDFLTYSRPKKLQYRRTDINRLLSEMVTFLTKDKELFSAFLKTCRWCRWMPVRSKRLFQTY